MYEYSLTQDDLSKIEDKIENTKTNVSYIEDMINHVLEDYTFHLDTIMRNIYKDIIEPDITAPLNTLEKYFFELSNELYYAGDRLEQLGIYDVVSKNACKEVYNANYLKLTSVEESKKKPTVAELTALSEKASQYEEVVNSIYNKAYKMFKNKIDAATVMLNTISKIISKRINEMQLNSIPPSMVSSSGKQRLNENSSYIKINGVETNPF